MNKFDKVEKLRKGTDQELANELSQEIKQDTIGNAERFSNSNNAKDKSAAGVEDALKKEAEFLD